MPPVITIGALPFTHSKLSVERTLKTFEGYLGWLARADRNTPMDRACYTPDWRRRNNLIQDREPQDTPEDRADWFRFVLGTAMAYGMDLPTTSHPDPVELVWAVARWAHGALLHIQDLQGQVQRLNGEQIAEDMKHADERRALQGRIDELNAAVNRADETLREANAREESMAAKLADLQRQMREAGEDRQRSERRLKDEIDALASEVKRADSERDAWRMTATATSAALQTLRAALRIPAGPVTGPAEVVDLSDPADVAKTALVRR